VPLVIKSLKKTGIPDVQVIYFPGIDLYTHIADNVLHDQVEYFKTPIDPSVGQIVNEYRKQGALDSTYVIFISDHGHTPVLKDKIYTLAAKSNACAPKLLTSLGFKVRPLKINPSVTDYTATLAYQGAMPYVYLANREICSDGKRCDWSKPPRFNEDVMTVARAFYEANMSGASSPGLKRTPDLIFARKPRPTGTSTLPYMIFDGNRLIPIKQYLDKHPRPDLIQLERRIGWLSAGPWGNHADDVLLLSKVGTQPSD
jgi:hypothetical protein